MHGIGQAVLRKFTFRIARVQIIVDAQSSTNLLLRLIREGFCRLLTELHILGETVTEPHPSECAKSARLFGL